MPRQKLLYNLCDRCGILLVGPDNSPKLEDVQLLVCKNSRPNTILQKRKVQRAIHTQPSDVPVLHVSIRNSSQLDVFWKDFAQNTAAIFNHIRYGIHSIYGQLNSINGFQMILWRYHNENKHDSYARSW